MNSEPLMVILSLTIAKKESCPMCSQKAHTAL